jgi:CRISPR-associated protein Csb2
MLTLGLRYLNGWAMATHPADRERPEWPPHPDRVFMALAAACFETGGSEAEIGVLEWLERQGAPNLVASPATERTPVTSFVPINDRADPVKKNRPLPAMGSLPIGRDRQPRQFPVAVPENPTVHLRWPAAEPSPDDRRRLADLCRKVTHAGHSASLVQLWIEEGEVSTDGRRAELVPVEAAASRHRLRVAGPGRLDSLRHDFAAGRRPTPSHWQGYDAPPPTQAEPQVPTTLFADDLLVLRHVEGRPLGLESTLQVTAALHKTALKLCPDPPPEWLSGHLPDGGPSERDHTAFLPLAHVGREHADGHLLGLAIAAPAGISREEIAGALGPLLFDHVGRTRRIDLLLGRLGRWTVELEERDARALALRSEIWTAKSRRWATVTPIALDRHPKGADRWRQVEESISRGCRRIGLPSPSEVVAAPVSLFEGSPHARSFPNLRRKSDGGRVFHTHAVVAFTEPVQGPLLVGAGRYRGYGFFRPLRREGED